MYFVQCLPFEGTFGPILIDATKNLAAQLEALVRYNAYPLVLLGVVQTDDPEGVGRGLHKQFAASRVHDLWFKPTDDLLTFIRTRTQRLAAPPAPTVPTDTLLTIEDVARLLNISEPTARRLEESGQIPSIRIGRQVRFNPKDIMALFGKPK